MPTKSEEKFSTEEWKKSMLSSSKEDLIDALDKCNEAHNDRISNEYNWIQYMKLCSWKDKYDMNFQMYNGDFNIYLSKDDVSIFDTGGHSSPEEAIKVVLEWINRVNKKK